MLYLFHRAEDLHTVKEVIEPLLQERSFQRVVFPSAKGFEPLQDGLVLLYLPQAELREVLIASCERKWVTGILPHPDNGYAIGGLGISENLETALSDILTTEEPQELDLVFCNGIPFFQSLSIGNIFLLKKKERQGNFFLELLEIFRNIGRAYTLKHQEFILSADGEKILHTSAMGIIVVEHSKNSLISRRLVKKSSERDGIFHALILAPENLLVLLLFLLRSLWPRKKPIPKLPAFIGNIETPNLKIEGGSDFEYTVDGEQCTSKELILEIKEKALLLNQKNKFGRIKGGPNGKKSLKVTGLPTGEKRQELLKHGLPVLPRATTEEFAELFKLLREHSTITRPYIAMMILSTLIASFGLFGDSSPVIIGAMILAPIIAPIVSFAMGMVRYDVSMLRKSIVTIIAGTLVSLVCAAAVSLIIPLEIMTSEIEARLSPTLLDMGIAVASGIAAAYAHAEEGIAQSLAGVAIAVALVPPLSVAGIGLGWMDWQVFSGAFLLYLTNLSGIILFAGLTFLLLGFAPFKRAKMGLVYTLVIVLLVAVPLSLSFNRIIKEARITRTLEGTTIDAVVLRDVRIRFGEPLVISLKLVGTEAMEQEKVEKIKKEIEKRIKEPIALEVVSAIEY